MVWHMNFKQVILSGLIAGFIGFIVGSALYLNPLISGVYAEYGSWPGAKPMEDVGGIVNWMILMLFGGLFSTVFLAMLYDYAEKGIFASRPWKKGIFFGFLVWLVYKIPMSYYIWLMYKVPDILNIIETFNGLIGSLVVGYVLAILHEKLK